MPDDAELYQGQPMIAFASPEAWETWLATASDGSAGVWLKLAKKGCAETTVRGYAFRGLKALRIELAPAGAVTEGGAS